MNLEDDPYTMHWFLRHPDPLHSKELAHRGYEDEPIMLNYGYGERPFGVDAALAWAERMADDLLEPQP